MAAGAEVRRLTAALREVGAKSHQITMAAILLAVNGLDNALEFVYGLRARGLTEVPPVTEKPNEPLIGG